MPRRTCAAPRSWARCSARSRAGLTSVPGPRALLDRVRPLSKHPHRRDLPPRSGIVAGCREVA